MPSYLPFSTLALPLLCPSFLPLSPPCTTLSLFFVRPSSSTSSDGRPFAVLSLSLSIVLAFRRLFAALQPPFTTLPLVIHHPIIIPSLPLYHPFTVPPPPHSTPSPPLRRLPLARPFTTAPPIPSHCPSVSPPPPLSPLHHSPASPASDGRPRGYGRR